MMEIIPEEHNVEMTGLRHVYNRYIKRTRFRDIYDPFVSIQDRDSFLIYYVGDVTNILGFSKIKRYWFQEELLNYNNRREIRRMKPDQCYAMESVLHANTVPISKITVDMEASWAKKKGMSELYLGRGTTWSSDKKKYTRLCERDSSVKKISDLAT